VAREVELAALKPKVFLDANVVIAAGKPPGGPELARVIDLVDADLITVLTTDLTITEVAKKYAQNDYDLIKEISQPHFRDAVKAATGVDLPAIKRKDLREKILEIYRASTEKMFQSLKAKTLAIDTVKPSVVFGAYAAQEGFFSGDGKKDQFPDAFIFECLKAEASAEEPVVIVSQDGDFDAPVKPEPHLRVVKTLPDLFSELGLQIDAIDLEMFFEIAKDELVKAVDKQLSDWGLQGDIEDSEIDESSVTNVEIERLTAFKSAQAGDPILGVGTLTVTADVSYTHPDWDSAIWDSEDKVAIPFHTVSGETEVELNIDVSISVDVDANGDPVSIAKLTFRNDKFVYVTLSSDDDHR
jgi:hypothetical protein